MAPEKKIYEFGGSLMYDFQDEILGLLEKNIRMTNDHHNRYVCNDYWMPMKKVNAGQCIVSRMMGWRLGKLVKHHWAEQQAELSD